MAKIQAFQCWRTLHAGCTIVKPGNAADFKTGDWRTGKKPVTDLDKCVKCGRCYIFCPDLSYIPRADGKYDWDGNYCKGCGICAVECPAKAIAMVDEGGQNG